MKLGQPVPELPVADVESAQAYFRDRFGFKVEWLYPGGEIDAVSHGESAIFFRRIADPIHPGTFWIFAEDVDAAHRDRSSEGQTSLTTSQTNRGACLNSRSRV